MAARRDYYEVLGVPPDADAAAIRNAFRQLARRYHPDISTEPDAEQRFTEIAEARQRQLRVHHPKWMPKDLAGLHIVVKVHDGGFGFKHNAFGSVSPPAGSTVRLPTTRSPAATSTSASEPGRPTCGPFPAGGPHVRLAARNRCTVTPPVLLILPAQFRCDAGHSRPTWHRSRIRLHPAARRAFPRGRFAGSRRALTVAVPDYALHVPSPAVVICLCRPGRRR